MIFDHGLDICHTHARQYQPFGQQIRHLCHGRVVLRQLIDNLLGGAARLEISTKRTKWAHIVLTEFGINCDVTLTSSIVRKCLVPWCSRVCRISINIRLSLLVDFPLVRPLLRSVKWNSRKLDFCRFLWKFLCFIYIIVTGWPVSTPAIVFVLLFHCRHFALCVFYSCLAYLRYFFEIADSKCRFYQKLFSNLLNWTELKTICWYNAMCCQKVVRRWHKCDAMTHKFTKRSAARCVWIVINVDERKGNASGAFWWTLHQIHLQVLLVPKFHFNKFYGLIYARKETSTNI